MAHAQSFRWSKATGANMHGLAASIPGSFLTLCTYSVGDEAVTAFEWVLIFNQLTNFQCHRFDVSCFCAGATSG